MLVRFENKGGALYGEISPDEKSAKITSLEVKKSFQKSGFGTELFERFQKEALRFNVERIEIDAYKKSLDFWRKKGFGVCDKPQVIDGFVQDFYSGSKELAFELIDLMSDSEREAAIEELINRSEAEEMKRDLDIEDFIEIEKVILRQTNISKKLDEIQASEEVEDMTDEQRKSAFDKLAHEEGYLERG